MSERSEEYVRIRKGTLESFKAHNLTALDDELARAVRRSYVIHRQIMTTNNETVPYSSRCHLMTTTTGHAWETVLPKSHRALTAKSLGTSSIRQPAVCLKSPPLCP
jgi:hypothetical protein